jgi:hypothetical protein
MLARAECVLFFIYYIYIHRIINVLESSFMTVLVQVRIELCFVDYTLDIRLH